MDNMSKFACTFAGCDKVFDQKRVLTRHILTHGDVRFLCVNCDKVFGRKDRVKRHQLVCKPASDAEVVHVQPSTKPVVNEPAIKKLMLDSVYSDNNLTPDLLTAPSCVVRPESTMDVHQPIDPLAKSVVVGSKTCEKCQKTFKRNGNRLIHQAKCTGTTVCSKCGKDFDDRVWQACMPEM